MSAVVCGKRAYFHLEERLGPSDVVASKRCRRFSSSPPGSSPPWASPPDSRRSSPGLSRLLELFPDMEKTVIERVFNEYGDDIDAAINKLKELHIEAAEENAGPVARNLITGTHEAAQPHLNGAVDQKSSETCFTHTDDAPSDGSGWLDLFVTEMSQASSIDDLKSRASRALVTLEKNITARVAAETGKDLQKENMVLKEQVGSLLRDKHILKRAVAIQHERQREYNDKIQDFEQLINQYKEQVRSLEINNYALTMHLKQAQSGSSIPGRFHPDVF